MRYWCLVESPEYIQKLALRFSQKSKPHTNGCIMWEGSRVGFYGQIKVANKNELAHRVALMLSGKNVPTNLDVLHKCDNGLCVNPNHLFIGNHSDNMADKAQKGRAPSKLTAAKVRWVKHQLAAGKSCNSLAVKLGMNPHAISDIRDRITWKHITI